MARKARLLIAGIAIAGLLVMWATAGAWASFQDNYYTPVVANINGGYLYGEAGSGGSGHTGVDFSASIGSAVYAAEAGTVTVSTFSHDPAFSSGTVAAAGSNTVTLSATYTFSAAYDDVIYMTMPNGTVQSRGISAYNSSTKTATVYPAWSTVPAVGTSYSIAKYTSYGENITIQHPNGTYTVYAHLSQRLVANGASITRGQYIGYSGDTGNSSGPHMHFEVRRTSSYNEVRNPECFLARSMAYPFGAVRGLVRNSGGTALRQVRVAGASKPLDSGYGASYTYGTHPNGIAFGDVAEYGINYYIGSATSGSVTLTYTYSGSTTSQLVTIPTAADVAIPTVQFP